MNDLLTVAEMDELDRQYWESVYFDEAVDALLDGTAEAIPGSIAEEIIAATPKEIVD